ncbi:MAG: cupin domain-containing protein [Candidatus Dormibacteraeota bacterium]|uniref:Cupin domain-containing protein n=1 Tax=Candidatus Amunia macphersoniae TaxID=3127014 RepID=A0A934KL37_9BACT|nr:cupin domain-containing protein [Candidatus Dormibacteraeota bacterium]
MTDDAVDLHRSLSANVIALDWHEEIGALRSSASYASADHSARTLAKHPAMRLVLVAMKSGGRMEEHHTDSAITVQCLEGRLHFEVGGATHDLVPGHFLVVTERLPHSVVAIEECAFLLTIGEQRRTQERAVEDEAMAKDEP